MAGKSGQPSHETPRPREEGSRHTDKQWKVEGWRKRKTTSRIAQNALAPPTPINELQNPKHQEPDACVRITKLLITIDRSHS